MRIILSRKGVDSSSGGFPSPIIDGRLISLPIPDGTSQISYEDLKYRRISLGKVVEDLSRGRISAKRTIHLDPDLHTHIYRRLPGWRPILGQGQSAAESHLKSCGVTVGDLFLFFGWFREAELKNEKYRYKPGAPDLHIVYGWLQVGAIISCADQKLSDIPWAQYHPHFRRRYGTAYIAVRNLELGGRRYNLTGGGQFLDYHKSLRLTAPNSVSRRTWQLPGWCCPRNGCMPLTYHPKMESFQKKDEYTVLTSAGRGQEFVIDSRCYPEAVAWAKNLILHANLGK